MCEANNEASDRVGLKDIYFILCFYKTIPNPNSFQYFKISIYIKSVKAVEMNCSLKSPLDCAELHSLPFSVVQWGECINNIIMMGYLTQKSAWLLLFWAKAPASLALPLMKMQRMWNEAHCDGSWREGQYDWPLGQTRLYALFFLRVKQEDWDYSNNCIMDSEAATRS